ncbi:MAG: hypothetical protein IKQ92_04220 [Clostridia bacterium]|nr:hypothetical protein [Clostridia bacterium]
MKIKRTIGMLLAIVLLLPVFGSCGSDARNAVPIIREELIEKVEKINKKAGSSQTFTAQTLEELGKEYKNTVVSVIGFTNTLTEFDKLYLQDGYQGKGIIIKPVAWENSSLEKEYNDLVDMGNIRSVQMTGTIREFEKFGYEQLVLCMKVKSFFARDVNSGKEENPDESAPAFNTKDHPIPLSAERVYRDILAHEKGKLSLSYSFSGLERALAENYTGAWVEFTSDFSKDIISDYDRFESRNTAITTAIGGQLMVSVHFIADRGKFSELTDDGSYGSKITVVGRVVSVSYNDERNGGRFAFNLVGVEIKQAQ